MKTRRLIFAAAAILSVTASAFAGSVDVQCIGGGLGRHVEVSFGGSSFDTFAGQIVHNFSSGKGDCAGLNGDMITFCTELAQQVSGDVSGYESTELYNAPLTVPMGREKAQAIRDMYAQADGDQFATQASAGNRDCAAAFQIAIWEVVHDYDGTLASLDLDSGNFSASGTGNRHLGQGITSDLASLLSAIGSDAEVEGLMAITNGKFQDQLVMVPLPAGLLLGAAGLLGLGCCRRRLRAAI